MPIIKFSGVSPESVEKYSQKKQEIAELISASPENIIFICENSITFPKENNLSPIYITVEWMKRESKEQLLANHLVENFSKFANKVWVFFTDVNGKIYMDGNKIG